jgi:superfamily II DNA or RNA helicase
VVEVRLRWVDAAHMEVVADRSVMMELSDAFTFDVPGAKHMPAYKSRFWDGKIRLLNVNTGLIYAGLMPRVAMWCRELGYEVEVDPRLLESGYDGIRLTKETALEFISTLNLPTDRTPRDYQVDALVDAINGRRLLLISPTASGKSLIIYMIARYVRGRTLVIVPTVGLVGQMVSDFTEYGMPDGWVGSGRDSDARVVVVTWQSVFKLGREFFDRFEVIVGDEAHLWKAKSLVRLMTSASSVERRVGMTGTLDGSETNRLVLEGLFGPVKRTITTREMIDRGYASDLSIDVVVLKYPDVVSRVCRRMSYDEEMDFILSCPERDDVIAGIVSKLRGNTVVLFQYVEKHGVRLYEAIRRACPDRPIYLVHGKLGLSEGDREEMRRSIAAETDCVVVASYGTFSTGVNINSLTNLLFASPFKTSVRSRQSIGRILRLFVGKSTARLYDVADDLSYGGRKNFTLEHMILRVKTYSEERFNRIRVYEVPIEVSLND